MTEPILPPVKPIPIKDRVSAGYRLRKGLRLRPAVAGKGVSCGLMLVSGCDDGGRKKVLL